MAIRRRRRFGRRRASGGSRWADAGTRRGAPVRAKREWTRYFEEPECGGLKPYIPNHFDDPECWEQEDVVLVGSTGVSNENLESTILAIRGWFYPFTIIGPCSSPAQAGLSPTAAGANTGLGFGLQLGPRNRDVLAVPHMWNDVDNGDWLLRMWFPPRRICDQENNTYELQAQQTGVIAESMSRKIDWSEWVLWYTVAQSASDLALSDETVYGFQLRVYEQFTPGQLP